MEEITVRRAAPQDIAAAGAQIFTAYKAAYRGLMSDEYLDAMPGGY